jgi:hypothetical protein
MFICEPIRDIKGISPQILPHKYLDDIHIPVIKQKSFYKTETFLNFSHETDCIMCALYSAVILDLLTDCPAAQVEECDAPI